MKKQIASKACSFALTTWTGRILVLFLLFVSTPYLWVTPWFIHFSWPGAITQMLYTYATGGEKMLYVTKTEATTNDQTKEKEYQVWGRWSTDNPNGSVRTFKVQDTWWRGVTRSADTYGQLTADKWFRVKYYGWRLGIFSLKPNIVRAIPAPAATAQPPSTK